MEEEAGQVFAKFFNETELRIDQLSSEDPALGLLNKTPGQVMRLCLPLQAAFDALSSAPEGNLKVTASTVKLAIQIVELCAEQRSLQNKPASTTHNVTEYDAMSDEQIITNHSTKKIFLMQTEIVHPRMLQQAKIFKTADMAKNLLKRVADCGLGEIVQGNNQKSIALKKQKLCAEISKKMGIH